MRKLQHYKNYSSPSLLSSACLVLLFVRVHLFIKLIVVVHLLFVLLVSSLFFFMFLSFLFSCFLSFFPAFCLPFLLSFSYFFPSCIMSFMIAFFHCFFLSVLFLLSPSCFALSSTFRFLSFFLSFFACFSSSLCLDFFVFSGLPSYCFGYVSIYLCGVAIYLKPSVCLPSMRQQVDPFVSLSFSMSRHAWSPLYVKPLLTFCSASLSLSRFISSMFFLSFALFFLSVSFFRSLSLSLSLCFYVFPSIYLSIDLGKLRRLPRNLCLTLRKICACHEVCARPCESAARAT